MIEARIERFLQPTRVRVLCLTLLSFGLTLYMYWPAVTSYPLTPWGDGQYAQHFVEAGKVSISRYHELPLWNPFECAGNPLWDEPASLVASPLILLMQPLSSTLTMRLWNIVHHAIGFIGMWLLSRHELRLSRGASLVASTVFALTLGHTRQYAGGHAALVGFLYAPLALLLWRRAERDLRFAVGVGLLFAWTFYEGGCYPVPHLGLMLAIEGLIRLRRRNVLDLLRSGAVAVVTFVTVGAARILPVVDQLRHHTRILGPETDAISRKLLGEMFFARPHEGRVPGLEYALSEYNSYVGWIIAGLALIGIFLSIRNRAWFFVLGVCVFALMMGHFARWAPWHLLKEHVFPFKSMRVPSRFRLFFVLFVGGWAGFAVDRLPPLVARQFGDRVGVAARTAVLGIALIGAGDALGVSTTTIASIYTGAPTADVQASPQLFIGGHLAPYLDQPRQNQGRTRCWEEWNFTAGAPVWEGDVPQARVEQGNDIVIENVSRTQNTFTIDVDANAPGRIRVNSPYERGWQTDYGTIDNDKKLLVVDVPAGRAEIHLRYWPHGLTAGFVLTALGVSATIAFFVWDSRRRRAARATTAGGPATAA
jgi:uncharacterized membrane protein YbaN (DUF454 family)